MKKNSKRYKSSLQNVETTKKYPLENAVEVLQGLAQAKFDETVELSVRLGGIDPKQSDQMVRGVVKLPHGSGRKVRVLVFTENPQAALDAGAEHAGLDDYLAKIQEGWLDFDVAISTSSAMKEVRKAARVLGPRGMMPNPKSGTVVEADKIAEAIEEVKAGRVEFKMDKTANMAVVIGKRSFAKDKLVDNARSAIEAIGKLRPENCKGRYITGMTISSTMSPGVKLDGKEYSQF